MIIDEETNEVYVSALLKNKYPQLQKSLSAILSEENIPLIELENTKDIWCRDYMPVQISDNEFVQFTYNPSYLADPKYQSTKTNPFEVYATMGLNVTPSEILIDGGNVVRGKRKAILTERIYRENKSEKGEAIKKLLQVEELIIIPELPNDFCGHADGMIRFIDDNTVLLNVFEKFAKRFHNMIEGILHVHKLKIIYLPWDGWENKTIEEDTGDYINFLHVGNLIIIPKFKSDTDEYARYIITEAFPNAKVKGVDCREIALEGGLLNCCTWNIKRN